MLIGYCIIVSNYVIYLQCRIGPNQSMLFYLPAIYELNEFFSIFSSLVVHIPHVMSNRLCRILS